MIRATVDQAAVAAVIRQLGSTPAQVQQATSSALRKMRRRVETAVKRVAAKELKMPQKALGKRFYSDPVRKGDEQMKMWVGTQPISPFDLGTVGIYGEKGRPFSGVMVGRRKYKGAFLASIYTARKKVWIRLGSKFFAPNLYPTAHRPGNRGNTDGRFPVIRAAVPIDEVMETVVTKYEPDILDDYEKILLQELNYFTNIRPTQARTR